MAGLTRLAAVLHGDAAAGGQGHHVIGADRQDVAGAAFADAPAQVKAAVHLVAGDEGGADAPVVRVLQQIAGQLRLGREHDLVRDPGQLAALLVGGPVRGQVQGPADQRVPGRGRVGEGDRDLAQGDAADGAAVLAGRAGAVGGGLLVGGLVHDQHHVAVVLVLACGKMPGGPVRGGVQHLLLIDAGAGQQVLHPVRARVPGGLAPSSSSCDPRVRSAGRAPCHGRSGGSPAGRSTARPAPSGHRAGPHARHGLPWHQRLSCDCLVPQTGMITAAAPAFPHLRPSVTSVSGQRDAPRCGETAVTCSNAIQVTIYNCRT